VVHHAPAAMWPCSPAVVSRFISISFSKVIVQSEALVSPTACGFHRILFRSGLEAMSPSTFIISRVEFVRFCSDVWLLLEKDVLDKIKVGRLTSSMSNVMWRLCISSAFSFTMMPLFSG
jgi:hypothetical protein